MELVFSDDKFPSVVNKSIFLAGPSPRYALGDKVDLNTWRHKAVQLLQERWYDGIVYIPLPRSAFFGETYVDQNGYVKEIEWDLKAFNRADVIFIYLDRQADNQGLVTNVEFGRYFDSGRMVYCRPKSAVFVRYLDTLMMSKDREFYTEMEEGIEECLDRVKNVKTRFGNAVIVPSIIHDSPQFQAWYKHHREVGNALVGFEIKSIITYNNDRELFGFTARVSIYVESEDRYKSKEWIFSRVDASHVVLYYDDFIKGRQYVLAKEFRSPTHNLEGFSYAFPGGSSTDPEITPLENAVKEVEEETGLTLPEERFVYLGTKQTFGIMLTMQMHAYAVRLNYKEFRVISERAEKATVFSASETERVTLVIASEKDVVSGKCPCDWTTLGLIKAVDSTQGDNDEFSLHVL